MQKIKVEYRDQSLIGFIRALTPMGSKNNKRKEPFEFALSVRLNFQLFFVASCFMLFDSTA